MGKSSRYRPQHLAEKLLKIRTELGLSQDEMLTTLGFRDKSGYERSVISSYEVDKREPTLDVLLAYANCANVYVDVLIDDHLSLPKRIPAQTKSNGKPANKKTR